MDYRLPLFIENEVFNKKGESDGVNKVERVDFKLNSCG